jgi:hypothetical protein
MRKIISLALVAIIIALPAPAMQAVTPVGSPAPVVADNFGVLLQDPFLIDALTFESPRSVGEVS